MTTLGETVALIHDWYPPGTAESWDAVGLVAGDPAAPVRKVMVAVDPTEAVAREAAAWDADLLVVHHPLFLTGVHSVAATTPKGRALAALTSAGCGLLTAHTNADHAVGGVSEALATALGMSRLRPIRPAPTEPLDVLVAFVPTDAAPPVRAAVAEAGAGAIGDYDHCTFTTAGQGRFRPLPGADPTIGEVGSLAVVEEERIEVVLPRRLRAQVVAAMRAAHPYEEPAHSLIELASPGSLEAGTGRVGEVEPTTLRGFLETVAEALPATAQGVRALGAPDRVVRRVAVCGGSGDFLLDELASAPVDVYLTSDLKHHRALDFAEAAGPEGPALVDVAHWAAESTWLPVLAGRLTAALGDTVETRVSETRTDPWDLRV